MQRIGLAVVVTLNLLLASLAVDAQPSEKVYRIGMLERTSKTLNAASLNGFLRGMQELGYVEGKHFVIEYRSADGLDERFQEHQYCGELDGAVEGGRVWMTRTSSNWGDRAGAQRIEQHNGGSAFEPEEDTACVALASLR